MNSKLIEKSRKLICTKLSTDFRASTQLVPVQIPQPLPKGCVLVKTTHVAVNASDVNFTAGKYTPDVSPPFDVGFEALAEVVEAASDVDSVSVIPRQHQPAPRLHCLQLKAGDAVAITQFGAFSELLVTKAKAAVPLPEADPQVRVFLWSIERHVDTVSLQMMPLFVSGLTASIALEEVGEMPQSGGGCTVLVTAAAGGTGQMAVQLAKAAGHTVIGTTSSDSKGEYLKSLGVDRVVNYKTEDLHAVLKKEYPSGIDIV